MRLLLLAFVMSSFVAAAQTIVGKTNPVSVNYKEVKVVEAKPVRKYRALIIGVSKYQHESPGLQSLDNPVRDAQMVYDALTQHYTFNKEDVILLKDPTRKEIIDGLEKISTDAQETDNVLLFYAGHGVWDKQKEIGYWLPSDARIDSRSDWVSNSQIKDYLSETGIRSKHTLLVTDACFGGSIFKSRAASTETLIRVSEMYKEPSRTAMTSGSLSTVPDKSVFIQQFVKKLVENEDEYLPARLLFNRIYEPIINNSSTNPLYGVIQGAGDGGGDFIFVKR